MSESDKIWTKLTVELSARLGTVGFSSIDFPAPTPDGLHMVNFTAFLAPYGLLYCLQIREESFQTISRAITFACETMRTALTEADANDWTRDGYLILAIPSAPVVEEVRQLLRDFEQGRSICRRHVVWPGRDKNAQGDLSWAFKLDSVTVLPLPEPEKSSARTELPETSSWFVEHIHNRIGSGGTYTDVAAELELAVREREDFDAS